MVHDNQVSHVSQAAAIKAIAPKIGCGRDTLRRWVQQKEIDTGRRDGVTSEKRARIRELEREVRALRQANEILKKASVHFAQAIAQPVPIGVSDQRSQILAG